MDWAVPDRAVLDPAVLYRMVPDPAVLDWQALGLDPTVSPPECDSGGDQSASAPRRVAILRGGMSSTAEGSSSGEEDRLASFTDLGESGMAFAAGVLTFYGRSVYPPP